MLGRAKRDMVARVHLVIDVPFTAKVEDGTPDVGERVCPDGKVRVGLMDPVKHARQAMLVESQRAEAARDAESLAVTVAEKAAKFGAVVSHLVEEVRDA